MGTTRVLRFRNFTIMPDPLGLPTFEARCVSGDEEECGAESGEHDAVAGRDDWVQRHFKATGHQRYQHVLSDYRIIEPGEWL